MSRALLFAMSFAIAATIVWVATSGSGAVADAELAPAGGPVAQPRDAHAAPLQALAPTPDGGTESPAPEPGTQAQPTGEARPAPRESADEPGVNLVHGRVLDPGGNPIDRTFVTLVDASGASRLLRCEEDGRYMIIDAPSGEVQLEAGSLGWSDSVVALELEPGAVREQDFTLQRAPMISIRLATPDGRPLREGLNGAGFTLHPRYIPAATIDEPGTVLDPPHPWGNNTYGAAAWWDRGHISAPPSDAVDSFGILLLESPPPVWVSFVVEQQVLRKVKVEDASTEVRFVISMDELRALQGSVRVLVLDGETDAPLHAMGKIHYHSWQTDADGELLIDECWPGPTSLVLEAPGRTRETLQFELAAGEAIDLGTVRLVRPAPFSGRVVDADGVQLSVDLRIESIEKNPDGAPRHRTRSSTNAAGEFSCDEFPPGRYLVRVSGDDEFRRPRAPETVWTSAALEVDTRAGERRDLVLVATPPTPVNIEAPHLAAPVNLELLDGQGRVLRRRNLQPEKTWSLKLPSGEHTLIGTRAGAEVLRRVLIVTPEPQRVSLTLE